LADNAPLNSLLNSPSLLTLHDHVANMFLIFMNAETTGKCGVKKLSDMIDALIKRVSATYKCYEMYAHRGKKVQLLVFCDRPRNGKVKKCL
jgi:hypothetical protein